MTEDWVNAYIRAGKAVIAAKKLAKKMVKPGIKFLEIANKCELEIRNNGCELSFPINISFDKIAAHYSPPINDATVVPQSGLLKLDIGSHYNGYIADSAITINLDGDEILQTYINAADEALEAAIEIFKPGAKLYELGEAIEKKIKNYKLNPIYNLGGHQLKQYDLHAGKFIPNFKDIKHGHILEPGDTYACEPFATSGKGWVKNGDHCYIYKLVQMKKKKKNVSYDDLIKFNEIKKHFNYLPFSARLLEMKNALSGDNIQNVINQLLRKGLLKDYPILIESSGKPVAQQEHTIIIDMDGNTIVTTKE